MTSASKSPISPKEQTSSSETDCAVEPQKDTDKPETPSQLAGDYEFEACLGKGGQGQVFRAKDLRHGRTVAIKQLRISSVANWKEYDLFQREARVLSSLAISGVASVYETREYLDSNPPSAYIVQEYIDGRTLASLIESGARLPVHQVHDILVQLLAILQNLHAHDPVVIHRDIKPSNIILTPEGKVYLIDFGAVANPQVQGGGSTVAGTYGYMPPEQMMGHPVPESDIFSLAATAVQLFSGVSPENMETADFHLIFEPHMQSMPSALTYTLRAMLDPDLRHRFCDIPGLIRIFTSFQKGNYAIPDPIARIQNTLVTGDAPKLREWNRKLAAVDKINAPGNIDLWQQLPNRTPREIPKCYENPAGEDTQSATLDKANQASRALGTFFILLGLFAFIFGILEIVFEFLHTPAAIYFAWLVVPCLIVPLCIKIGLNLWSRNFLQSMEVPQLMRDRPPLDMTIYRDTIRKGEKTIATISEVQFVSQPDGFYTNEGRTQIVQVKSPLFKIRYRFNPESDHNPEDLEHEVYTRTPPEGHYDVGDPLPILYHVRVEGDVEIVFSMPFPLPMQERLELQYLLGESSFRIRSAARAGKLPARGRVTPS